MSQGAIDPADANGDTDIYLRDRTAGTTTLLSVGLGGAPADDDSYMPSSSDDGVAVAFASAATNLVAGDTNENQDGGEDIFVVDRSDDSLTRVSVSTGGTQANASSYSAEIAGDGGFVAYSSAASTLVPGDTNGRDDIFLSELSQGCNSGFSDVPATHTFCADILGAATGGYVNGYPDGTYRPVLAVSRGAMAAFLYRLQGSPPFVAPDTSSFSDVSTKHPFFKETEFLGDRLTLPPTTPARPALPSSGDPRRPAFKAQPRSGGAISFGGFGGYSRRCGERAG